MIKPGSNIHTLMICMTFLAAFFLWGCSSSSDQKPGSHDEKFKKFMEFHGENPCTFRMYWQGCACGDEYPQYVVDSVMYSENLEPEYFINKEFSLELADSSLDSIVGFQPGCASGCHQFILSGNSMAYGYGMHRLFVKKAERMVNEACCRATAPQNR
jgi:hypothetical protein